jgi:hypothetical protein
MEEPVQYQLADVVQEPREICLALLLDAKPGSEGACEYPCRNGVQPKGVQIDMLLAGACLETARCGASHTNACNFLEAEHRDRMFDGLYFVRQAVKRGICDAQHVDTHCRVFAYDQAKNPQIHVFIV